MCKCISAFAKCLLIAVNTVTLTIGLALIVVGSLMLHDKSFVANLLSNEVPPKPEVSLKILTEEEVNAELNSFFTTAGGIVLGIGIFIFGLSFVGFLGVLRKSRCLLIIVFSHLFLEYLGINGKYTFRFYCKINTYPMPKQNCKACNITTASHGKLPMTRSVLLMAY